MAFMNNFLSTGVNHKPTINHWQTWSHTTPHWLESYLQPKWQIYIIN
jgi:hypothetical protein